MVLGASRRISVDARLDRCAADGVPIYRNRALRAMLGTRSGDIATLEELFAQEPDSARAYFRLNRAAERGEAREEEFYFRAGIANAPGGRWLRASVQPVADSQNERAASQAQRTLWQIVDVTRERSREIESLSSL